MTTAMDSALAAIEHAFSPAARIEMQKRHVRQLMRLAPGHPEVWTRYQRLAERYPAVSLPVAIILVERNFRAELRLRDEAIRLWGRCSRPRLALMLLSEARVTLRWMRRYSPESFAEIRQVIITPELVKEAAE